MAGVLGGVLACLLATAAAAGAAPTVRPSEALQHLGESVVVEGGVDSVVCSPRACLLSFEPGFSGLVVAIPGDAVGAFPDPEATYESRRVRVSGTVQDRGGRPRIEVREPGAIALAEPGRPVVAGRVDSAAATRSAAAQPAPAPPATERSAAAQPTAPSAASAPAGALAEPSDDDDSGLPSRKVEVRVEGGGPAAAPGRSLSTAEAAARLGLDSPTVPSSRLREAARELARSDVADAPPTERPALGAESELRLLRQDLAALSARLGMIESRLDEVDERLIAIEELAIRSGAAAEAEAAERAPGLPSYIVPGSTSPRMHRVRTGWTAERVLRIMGEPIQVTGNPPGPFTWYFDRGRSCTIDQYGLVVSAVGF